MTRWRSPIGRRRISDPAVDEQISIEIDVTAATGIVIGDFFTPRRDARFPSLVVFHGCCGIKEDFTQFAHALATAGALVCNARWRCARTGDGVEASIEDMRRVVAVVRARWKQPVTVVAWSDATLPALAACLRVPARPVAGVVGLCGFYGWATREVPSRLINERTIRYFGASPSSAPERWEAANPYRLIERGTAIPIELVVGGNESHIGDARQFHGAMAWSGVAAGFTMVPNAGPYDLVIPRHPFGQRVICRIIDLSRLWNV
jgi:hypothetical protein